jgi:hypothetical protein
MIEEQCERSQRKHRRESAEAVTRRVQDMFFPPVPGLLTSHAHAADDVTASWLAAPPGWLAGCGRPAYDFLGKSEGDFKSESCKKAFFDREKPCKSHNFENFLNKN